MYPNQSGRALDKENDIVSENNASRTGATGPGGLHANLVKQNSLMGSRTPSKQQPQGFKMNPAGSKTPMQQGKVSNLSLNSPSAQSVLRPKTNYQLPPTASVVDNSNTANANQKKKSGLARTFSTVLESNNNNNNSTKVHSTPVKSDSSRRLSLTKRGSAKARLVVHKDEPAPDDVTQAPIKINLGTSQNIKTTGGGSGGEGGATTSHRPVTRLAEAAPLESTTTILSIGRSLESEDKVVVGQAKAETKRRALTNEDDKLEIEYCPPPVEERPYEPDFEVINYDVLKTDPPALAYQYKYFDYSEPPLPDFELLPTQRPSRALSSSPELSDTELHIPVAKTTLTADGHLDVTWSDDDADEENDGSPHPFGSITHSHTGPIGSGRRFGIKDLPNEDKLQAPFDGFMFDLSEDSLSEDEDDIFGSIGVGATSNSNNRSNRTGSKSSKDQVKGVAAEKADEFNKAFGLDDLEDESKVQAPFSDFSFEL
ncbi:hypothetical protein BGZ89_011098 [Linnemannia elongata]|nr:hypothetical protein BGZ89_011098 [Linnemannia elongata]